MKYNVLGRTGFKVSEIAHAPSDILIDTDILSAAPSVMIAAGAGDIMGKYTCLTDWRLAQNHLGEGVNEEAFSDTVDAVDKCFGSIEDIYARGAAGIGRLTDALIVSADPSASLLSDRINLINKYNTWCFFLCLPKKIPYF